MTRAKRPRRIDAALNDLGRAIDVALFQRVQNGLDDKYVLLDRRLLSGIKAAWLRVDAARKGGAV